MKQLKDLSDRPLADDFDCERCVAQRRDGQQVVFRMRGRTIHGPSGAAVGREFLAREATRQTEAELWLRQSERKFRQLVEGVRGEYIIYTRDASGVITYVSPSIETMLGHSRDEVVGRNWAELFDAEFNQSVRTLESRDIDENGRRVREIVVELPRRDGERRVFEVQEWRIFGVDGRCLAMEGIAKDVTHARHAEDEIRQVTEDLERRVALRTEELSRINEELRDSEARYRNVVDMLSEFIVRSLPDGTRTFVNKAYCEYFGGTVEEFTGTRFLPLIHPDDRGAVEQSTAALTPERPTATEEHRVYRADGTIGWNQWTSRALFDSNGQVVAYQSVGRDVTELKEAADLLRQKEAHLAHLSRLATMGEMVAGIAHELSQPLHAAKTFAEAARRHLESGRSKGTENAVECCNEISHAIVRTVEIIRRLRKFTTRQSRQDAADRLERRWRSRASK